MFRYTDISSDKSNCGRCGNRCSSGTCVNSNCNYDFNNYNTRCGKSAIACRDNQQCISGNCYPQSVTSIAKDQANNWYKSIKYKYQRYPDSTDPFDAQVQLSGKLIDSIPLISGSDENILSVELIDYNDSNYLCSFINYNNGNSPFVSFEKSKLIELNNNVYNYFCKINYIHFKYENIVYEIKVTPTGQCGATSTSNIAMMITV